MSTTAKIKKAEKEAQEEQRKMELDIQYFEKHQALAIESKKRTEMIQERRKNELCMRCRLYRYATSENPKCNYCTSNVPDYVTSLAYDYNGKHYVTACKRYTPHKCDGCDNMLTCAYTNSHGEKDPTKFDFIKKHVEVIARKYNMIAIVECAHYKSPAPRKPFNKAFAFSIVESLHEQVIEGDKKSFTRNNSYHPLNED